MRKILKYNGKMPKKLTEKNLSGHINIWQVLILAEVRKIYSKGIKYPTLTHQSGKKVEMQCYPVLLDM